MRKPISRLGMYQDIREILDAALISGGGEVTLPTRGQAIHWRHRAYKFRKLYAEAVDPNSPYDRLTFKAVDEDSCTVIIKSIGQPAKFTPAVGQVPVISGPVGNDELFELAKGFADKLGGSDALE